MTRRRATSIALAALLGCAAPARQAREVGRPSAAEPDRSRVPELGPPPALAIPAVTRFVLGNGLRVRLVEYHRLPLVALNLVVDAGAVHDPADRPGLAAFTAAMLTEGTTSRDATRISDDLAAIGAHLSAASGFDAAQLSGSALSRNLDGLLDLFADVVQNPAFAPADLSRVRDQRLVSLRQQRDQPSAVAAKVFAQIHWGSHPYGHWTLGTEESLEAVGRGELAAFHGRRWRPGNAELVVVGDVTRAEVEPRLTRALAGWTGAAPGRPAFPPPAPPRARTVLIEKKGAPQTFLILGTPGFARSDPDFPAAAVAFQILGGGQASRLFRHLREEKGYTYGMGARPEARRLGGTGVVGGSVKADQTGVALRALLGELEEIRERPVTAEELQTAKDGIILGLPSDFATSGAIAGKLAEAVVYGLPDDYWPRYADAVRRVTAEDVRRTARAWLDTSRITAVMVGDTAVVRPQLAGLPLAPAEERAAQASR
jgi:predicted Zn-dependent peptidase